MSTEIDYDKVLATMNLCVTNGTLVRLPKKKIDSPYWKDPEDLPENVKREIEKQELRRAMKRRRERAQRAQTLAFACWRTKYNTGRIRYENSNPACLYDINPKNVESVFPMSCKI